MASVFGHAVASIGLGTLFSHRFSKTKFSKTKFYILGIVSSIIPDLDVIGFYTGIPYESMMGHRGFTHSLFFAVAWALLLTFIFYRKEIKANKLIIGSYLFITTISHGILDALTTGGRGVAFWAPFSDERMFLPWRFIQVSPLGISNFFSEWGIKVLMSELVFIGLPILVLVIVSSMLVGKKR